ncbi:allophanate hydrolase [Bradyrhizobium sp. 2TAF24]|uniref:allophanate hydrolase n=1 Tax=Bradyrhizobium sp. 2TAF24 TaxID=3233011 RepID=UPI003F8F1DCB
MTATVPLHLDLPSLRAAYADGTLTPTAVVEAIFDAIARRGDDGVWVSLAPRAAALARARALEALPALARASLPLWGVPFSVKDCTDVAGVPTSSACPGFAYVPTENNPAVERLLAAGAIFIGKTNMDQFATGLVGVRSPHGVARNPFDARFIPGGSSSGAAVSVAAGLVSLALATDTGGSGRVPAALNNVVGLKPTRGLVSGVGNIAACRSIETLSVFALTVPDAQAAFEVIRGFDAHDPFARQATLAPRRLGDTFRFGVPRAAQLEFFGNGDAAALFDAAVRRLETLGGTRVEVDYGPFLEINDLLFQGPWLAERYGALQSFVDAQPEAILPVTRDILLGGARISGAQVFAAQRRLNLLKREIERLWLDIDVFAVPTTGTAYTIAELVADPITLNFRLGTYTNFVNLADLAAVAVPAGFLPNGVPQGISLITPAFADHDAAALAERFHRHQNLPLAARAVAAADRVAPSHRQEELTT